MGDPTLSAIGKKYGKSDSQVALRWLVQQEGVIAIPRSSSEKRIAENLDVCDFKLSDAEMAEISAMGSPQGRVVAVAFAPEWDE